MKALGLHWRDKNVSCLILDYDEKHSATLYGDLQLVITTKMFAGSGSHTMMFTRAGSYHPLEIFTDIEDVDFNGYYTEGIVRIKTKNDGYVIWQNNEFILEPPF